VVRLNVTEASRVKVANGVKLIVAVGGSVAKTTISVGAGVPSTGSVVTSDKITPKAVANAMTATAIIAIRTSSPKLRCTTHS